MNEEGAKGDYMWLLIRRPGFKESYENNKVYAN